ncbi:hypothetical protein [Paenibacillus sp. MMS18-CY102]|uniref:hypothetical protein n=1 Tax=Paenibacillus sp. MMS18-CY102 TaxID=2682849 RepID=UPI00136636E1|nr:hypothetical protein [Paenibacillus sp. MMS18-CY102]MWC27794.1 hypothetical protein [Paenibacillus sp. MMS18-CY102]
MPTIPNFPPQLLEEHRIWHHTNHVQSNFVPFGWGERFLRFHRQFIRKALNWYGQQGLDNRFVAPWQQVPEAVRNAPCYNRSAEFRIVSQPQSFATLDELGRFLESSQIHGCIHETAARIYREPEINDFDLAPRNTVFYSIHGLIDQWYANWEAATGQRGAGRRPFLQRDERT